jgi:hypothetical protein
MRSQQAKVIFHSIRAHDVPFYDLLDDYSWVTSFTEMERIKAEIEAVKNARRALHTEISDTNTYGKKISELYSQHRAEQIEAITNLLKRCRHSPSEFFIKLSAPFQEISLVPWELISAALKALPEQGRSQHKKEKELENLDKALAELSIKLDKLPMDKFFTMKNGKVISDIRVKFVEFWRHIQSQICEPVGPQGRYLQDSSKAEAAAWHALGLNNYIDEDAARFQAFPDPAYRE